MEEATITSTPTESAPPPAPVAEPAPAPANDAPAKNVYSLGRGYTDASKAMLGQTQTLLKEAQATPNAEPAKPETHRDRYGRFTAPDLQPTDQVKEAATEKPDTKDPHQRFGLSEERKHELAAQLKAAKTGQPVAAAATAKAKPVIDPVKLVGRFFDDDGEPADLLGNLYDTDYDRYQSVVDHVIDSNREYAMRRYGVDMGPMASDPEFAHLPEDLRQTAADLRPDILERLLWADPKEQEWHLRREKELGDAEFAKAEEERKAMDKAMDETADAAVGYSQHLITTAESEHMAAITKSLADLKPFGDKRDSAVHNLVLMAVQNDLSGARGQREMTGILQLANDIPHLYFDGKEKAAKAAEKRIQDRTAALYKEIGQRVDHYKKLLAKEFADARKWREHQQKLGLTEEGEERPPQAFDPAGRQQITGTRFYYPKKG